MKKSLIAGAGLAAFGFAGLPFMGAFATISGTPKTDTLQLTVADQCTLTRRSTPHGVGSLTGLSGASWTTSGQDTDVFEATVVPGLAYNGIATSAYNVACNHASGYQVAVTPTAFTTTDVQNAKTWAYNAGEYASSGSSWFIESNGTGASDPVASATTNIVVTEADETTSTDFDITYNVKVDAGQEIGGYSATATYVLTEI
ncbi:hypothetical protein IJF93_00545 [Candidatus Saccharibacteria bacterium]|nr:hypothetical protein [Candidatus Saccharibacteria bacterium]